MLWVLLYSACSQIIIIELRYKENTLSGIQCASSELTDYTYIAPQDIKKNRCCFLCRLALVDSVYAITSITERSHAESYIEIPS